MAIHIQNIINENFKHKSCFERKPLLGYEIEAFDLYKKFKDIFFEIEGKEFIANKESVLFVYTLIYFFQKKDNFYNSKLIFSYTSTKIDLNKGLIVVGGFGSGKTSILKVFQHMINIESKVNLKFITTVQAVSRFENIEDENMFDFKRRLTKGHLIIDDLLAEKQASRFGKSELFEEILFQRNESKNINTIITMNYDSEAPNDIEFVVIPEQTEHPIPVQTEHLILEQVV